MEKLERKKAKQLEKEAREGALRELEGRPRWAEELEQEREREEEREEEREWRGKWEREEEEEKGAREKMRLYRRRSNSSTHVSIEYMYILDHTLCIHVVEIKGSMYMYITAASSRVVRRAHLTGRRDTMTLLRRVRRTNTSVWYCHYFTRCTCTCTCISSYSILGCNHT